MKLDCNTIQEGYLRSICEGTSGLSPEVEEQYRQLWAGNQPAQSDFSCIHRGGLLRTIPCMLCGGREGIAEVLACAIFGECTLHSHGTREQGPRHATKLLAVCVGCEQRQSSECL